MIVSAPDTAAPTLVEVIWATLEAHGMVETHRLGVVLTIACDADAWEAHL